jgi:hypothetical protein
LTGTIRAPARRRVAIVALACGCALGSAATCRELSRAALAGGTGFAAPLDYSEFTPPPGARPPSQQLAGRLRLTRMGRNGLRMLVIDKGFLDASHREVGDLPRFDFEFVQSGSALIPVRRGAIAGSHPSWEFILEPGRAWEEEGDGGYSRAVLPFTLEERNENCMHNGVLNFLYRSDGRVTHAAWQVASETCRYEKFDAWGWLAAHYTPHTVRDADEIVAAYRHEVAVRMPVKPIAQLAVDHPGAVPGNFGAAREVAPENMTVYGFVIDGVHYSGGCQTRHGEYPFCDVRDLPSYSLAKSLVGGVALMRLELLDPGASRRLIRDYVPECAADERWAGVSLANALDMATGLYASDVDEADENADITERLFFFQRDHAQKIRFACSEYPRRATPGTRWVYHSSDTYVLGTALNALLRKERGPGADFYRDLLSEPLWRPLGLSPPLMVTRRTYDRAAQPFTGFGLTLHRDDIVKLAAFLRTDEGRMGGKPMLDPALLAAAMQTVPDDRGLQASSAELRYQHGFWAYNLARLLGCRGEVWAPFMSGFGGVQVVMLPNGTTYYYVSDGNEFHWVAAAAESNRIPSFCQPCTA